MASNDNSSALGEDSDNDFDWEEVAVPDIAQQQLHDSAQDLLQSVIAQESYETEAGPSTKPNIEITIKTQRPKPSGKAEKNMKAVQMHAERLARLNCHKIHTVVLMGNARIRNKWLNDPLLHARLMSLTPLPLQNAFADITKVRIPEAVMRGRRFEAAITRLVEWWVSVFEIEPTGHIRSQAFSDVQQTTLKADPKGKGKAREVDNDLIDDDAEIIRSEKSLMKHALQWRGSRDVSAQLFTALCRAMGIPARLVVSLQSVPWQASAGKPKIPAKKTFKQSPEVVKGKGKAKATDAEIDQWQSDEDEDDDMEEVDIPNQSSEENKARSSPYFPGDGQQLNGSALAASKTSNKRKAPPVIRLRKSRGTKLGTAPTEPRPRREHTPDPETTAPVFWTEVFSRPDARWIPVDPIRCIVNKRLVFDPTPNPNIAGRPDRNRRVRVENRMVYVLAFEEDGYARDVTPRYAREYGAKVAKLQQGGKGRKEWWESILALVRRPYRLQRDDFEDEELQNKQMVEGMPTSMAGFKDHPLYVLSRHLKREEVIHPLVEIGKFRGEPVYPRSNVHVLKTAENWMRQGRRIREGCQPMKFVKQRAMTINRQREIVLALAGQNDAETPDGGDGQEQDVMQGMYAENQTELYIPDPVVDGIIPKNNFGNIDLYTPTMLPRGAVHVPFKGVAKIARQLGFDFAEAVTGFEFKKRRAFPVITGVVVAEENEAVLLEAYWEAERHAEEKRAAKRQEAVIKRWTKLIHGLRIRERLQEQYADRRGPSKPVEQAGFVIEGEDENEPVQPAGGFLTGADDIVQPYTLPKSIYATLKSSTISLTPQHTSDPVSSAVSAEPEEEDEWGNVLIMWPTDAKSPDGEDEGSNDDMEEIIHIDPPDASKLAPKTMRELAEDAAREQQRKFEESVASAKDDKPVPQKPSYRAVGQAVGASVSVTSDTGTTTPNGTVPNRSNVPKRKTPRAGKRTRTDSQNDSEEEITRPKRSAAKRARAAPVAPVPASDRVLRTRTPKSTEKVREEKEMDIAFRRATRE